MQREKAINHSESINKNKKQKRKKKKKYVNKETHNNINT